MSNRIILSNFNLEEIALTANTRKVLDGVAATRSTGERLSIVVTAGAADLYLGGPSLTVGTIPTVKAGLQIALDVGNLGLYAISASACTVSILEGF